MFLVEKQIKNVVHNLLHDKVMQEVAVRSIADDLDEIYGYGKLSETEIGAGIEDRLVDHPLAYAWIGLSVASITADDEIRLESRLDVASSYLNAVLANYVGVKRMESRWLEEDARGITETALFLDDNALFNWDNGKLVSCVIFCSYGSSPAASGSFFSRLVFHLNENRALFDFLVQDDALVAHDFGLSKLVIGREKGRGRSITDAISFTYKITNLLVSEKGVNSFELLCKLKWIDTGELVTIFLDRSLPLVARRMQNRAVGYDAFADSLIKSRGVECPDLLSRLLNRDKRKDMKLYYFEEPMLKAICNAAEKNGTVDSRTTTLASEFLRYSMETTTRFYLFKFIYRNTHDPEILKIAERSKSAKIRKWIDEQRHQL